MSEKRHIPEYSCTLTHQVLLRQVSFLTEPLHSFGQNGSVGFQHCKASTLWVRLRISLFGIYSSYPDDLAITGTLRRHNLLELTIFDTKVMKYPCSIVHYSETILQAHEQIEYRSYHMQLDQLYSLPKEA